MAKWIPIKYLFLNQFYSFWAKKKKKGLSSQRAIKINYQVVQAGNQSSKFIKTTNNEQQRTEVKSRKYYTPNSGVKWVKKLDKYVQYCVTCVAYATHHWRDCLSYFCHWPRVKLPPLSRHVSTEGFVLKFKHLAGQMSFFNELRNELGFFCFLFLPGCFLFVLLSRLIL